MSAIGTSTLGLYFQCITLGELIELKILYYNSTCDCHKYICCTVMYLYIALVVK